MPGEFNPVGDGVVGRVGAHEDFLLADLLDLHQLAFETK
jgi:hypothetical protein